MPSDKFLEIRPDVLATTFAVLGYYFLFRFFRQPKRIFLFLSGLLVSLSFLTIQKLGPSVVVSGAAILLFIFKKRESRFRYEFIFPFVIGVFFPWFLFLGWAIETRSFGLVLWSIIRLPVEHLSGVVRFNALPWDFFFQPNNTYYGDNGYGLGIIVNHVFWIFSIVLAAVRFVGAVLVKKTKRRIEEIVIAVTFFIYIAFYIWLSPLKFPQYLIAASVFVAWYVADWVYLFWTVLKKYLLPKSVLVAIGFLGLVGVYIFVQRVNQNKFNWTNIPHLSKMQYLYKTIPTSTYLLDLEGRSVYYRYPHPVCCLAFGQFETYLSRPYPSYATSLEKTQTKYIYQAEINRISALSKSDQDYIYTYFKPTLNGELWVRAK